MFWIHSIYKAGTVGVHTRTLYARRSPAFEIARLAYEPLTAPLIVIRERLVAATFRAIDMAIWSLDSYDEARAVDVFSDPETPVR